MKCFVVPSSLFIKGEIGRPHQLGDERDLIKRRIARIEADMRSLPKLRARVEQIQSELDEFEFKYGVKGG